MNSDNWNDTKLPELKRTSMGKTIEEMTFEELTEWAEGYILKELIGGNFRNAVYTVCSQSTLWKESQKKKTKKD